MRGGTSLCERMKSGTHGPFWRKCLWPTWPAIVNYFHLSERRRAKWIGKNSFTHTQSPLGNCFHVNRVSLFEDTHLQTFDFSSKTARWSSDFFKFYLLFLLITFFSSLLPETCFSKSMNRNLSFWLQRKFLVIHSFWQFRQWS